MKSQLPVVQVLQAPKIRARYKKMFTLLVVHKAGFPFIQPITGQRSTIGLLLLLPSIFGSLGGLLNEYPHSFRSPGAAYFPLAELYSDHLGDY